MSHFDWIALLPVTRVAPDPRNLVMKSVALQSVADLGGRFSVLARQKADHIKLERLLQQLDATDGNAKGQVLLKIYRLVFPHAFAEEAVLWPVIRRVLPDGNALTLEVEREHQAINELVTRLESLAPGSPEHEVLLERVVSLLRMDVRDEEDALLPPLQEKLSPAQLRMLGVAWEAVRRIAPTRPHPVVARRPPGNVLSALPLTLLDRSRDRVDALRHRRSAQARSPLAAASAGLSNLAHGVEHLPGMRSGEDPSTRIPRKSRIGWRTAAFALATVASLAAAGSFAGRRRRAVSRDS